MTEKMKQTCAVHQDMLGSRPAIIPKAWKDTIYLPKTTFPPRPVLAERAKYVQQCSDDLYQWQRANRNDGTFTLHDGPPYANGPLHIGHALNKILKDITCRFQLSQGKRVDFVPGWDCHGLPIELKALERLRAGQQKSGPSTFDEQRDGLGIRQAARKLAAVTMGNQKKQFREWAVMADWEMPWTTMDKQYEIKQLRVFEKLVQRGLVYRQFKPVFWSPSTKTALAEAELEYHDDSCTAAYVKMSLKDMPKGLGVPAKLDGLQAVIWTTMPWTLPANRAIGFNSKLDYVIVRSSQHGLLLFAKSRLATMKDLCGEGFTDFSPVHGSQLAGATYWDTTFHAESLARPFLHGDFVKADQGSGLVHLAPGHGKDDYILCLANGISPIAPVDDHGCYTSSACPDEPEFLIGKDAFTTGQASVLDRLELEGQLIGKHKHQHSYPHDWRSKQPVIVRATEQWFANVEDIQADALQAIESVKFIPESSKARLQSFVRNRNEWCISRQRAWGLPIPALYHQDTGEALLTQASVAHIISVIRDRGIDAWWGDKSTNPIWTPPGLRDPDGQSPYIRGKDTMDVWFDSGSSWSQIGDQAQVADLYLEGTDQHRGWFQSSLLTRIACQDSKSSTPFAPFRTLVTHGFTLDGKGKKMSKSENNVVSPDEITEGRLLPATKKKINGEMTEFRDAMGPDALRLWVAGCDYTKDVIVSPTVLKAVHSSLNRYRVILKLLLGLLQGYDPNSQNGNVIAGLNHKMALWQLERLETCVRLHYNNIDYHKVVAEINRYVLHDLSNVYLETVKDAAYCGSTKERHLVQATLNIIFQRLLQVLAPVTPLLVQETWEHTPKQIQISHGLSPCMRMWTISSQSQLLPDIDRLQLDKDAPLLLDLLRSIQAAAELARTDKKMGSSLQCSAMLHIDGRDENADIVKGLLDRYKDDLATLFIVSRLDYDYSDINGLRAQHLDWSYQSDCKVHGVKVVAQARAPELAKCVRCWRYAAPLEAKKEEALCERCQDVVEDLSVRRPYLFEKGDDVVAASAA